MRATRRLTRAALKRRLQHRRARHKSWKRTLRRRLVRIAGDAHWLNSEFRPDLCWTLWHAVVDGVSIPRSLRPGRKVDDAWRVLAHDPFVSDIVREYIRCSGVRL